MIAMYTRKFIETGKLTSWDTSKYFLCAVLLVLSRGLFANFVGGVSNFIVLPFFLLPLAILTINLKVYMIRFDWIMLCLTAFIIYVLMRSMVYDEPLRAFVGSPMFLYYPVIFFLFMIFVAYDEVFYSSINKVFIWIFIYLTVFALLQMITGKPLTAYVQKRMPMSMLFSIYPDFRLSSSFGSSLPFGVVYAMLCIYVYAKYIYSRKLSYLLLVFLSLVILFGVWSRGAFGMFCIGVVTANIYKYKERTRIHFSIKKHLWNKEPFRSIVWISLLGTLIAIIPASFFSRMYEIFNWSSELGNLKRADRWISTIDLVAEKAHTIMFGIGPGNTGNVITYFDFNPVFGGSVATESYYLKILLEMGIVGLALFMAFLICVICYGWSVKIRSSTKDEAIVKTAMISILIAHSVEMFFLQSLESTAVGVMFWLVVGVIAKIKISEGNGLLKENRNEREPQYG
jgi:O-antigen ligase